MLLQCIKDAIQQNPGNPILHKLLDQYQRIDITMLSHMRLLLYIRYDPDTKANKLKLRATKGWVPDPPLL